MRVLAGTSGFSFKEWVGSFYPAKLPASAMLAHYASRLPIVELNNTFYRMPTASAVEGWRAQVPATFRFAVKVPRRITHGKKLVDCGAELARLAAALRGLEPCVGSWLVQLPPHAKCDVAALEGFLAALPTGVRAAFEFRNTSWNVARVHELLTERDAALVQSEGDAAFEPLPWTASWAYLRLRKASYTRQELERWLERLAAARVAEAHVFFKHEDAATGPRLAAELLALAGA